MKPINSHSEDPSRPTLAPAATTATPTPLSDGYLYAESIELVQCVEAAANLIRARGEAAFAEFRSPGSRWRQAERYIFVLQLDGTMVVHADPEMEGTPQWDLQDVNGKRIVQGLLKAATGRPGQTGGWYHYEWPVPGGIVPRWKSSYVRLASSPFGRRYVVGSGVYNDRMEPEFVVDMVAQAVAELEQKGPAAFQLFHDATGPFKVKDSYIFVYDLDGINLCLPPFPSLEGRDFSSMKDPQGKCLIHEIRNIVETTGSGWIEYLWPKPGENAPRLKSDYVCKAALNGQTVAVGCGVYLTEAAAPRATTPKMTAPQLMKLVYDAAALLEKTGEDAYAEFSKRPSRWFSDETYVFAFAMDGTRIFHAAEPDSHGRHDLHLKDVLGRPMVEMMLDAASSPAGEGWVHYMWPEAGGVIPVWKSSFVKRVIYPSGRQHFVGSGIYNMQMDDVFIEDMVDHAAALIEAQGRAGFAALREVSGPFVFMDVYIFVLSVDGTELVNPAQPSLEGKNLLTLTDLQGKSVVQDEIAAALKQGSAWLDCYWYKPGTNTPALKHTYVRHVRHNDELFILGSGLYPLKPS